MSLIKELSIVKEHNWIIHQQILDELEPAIKKYAKGRLLDIGCGNKPYEFITKNFVDEHIGLEHKDSRNEVRADLWGSAYEIPVEPESFETILCNDVLEHLEEPYLALKESYRVLKNGGYAIYTMPFSWHIHEAPRDFFRYSKYGINHLFGSAGFEIVKIVPLTGFWGNIGQMLCYYLIEVSLLKKKSLVWLRRIIINRIQKICYKKDMKNKDEKFCSEYLVVAKKNVKTNN